ncbi:DUF2784 domain-containing protein [Methylibium sp.]|uniref:DUF2784 domain-containing protein n=1 Tax=Methylibium sp. TaxID=2067992 RepID=UPI0039C9BD77
MHFGVVGFVVGGLLAIVAGGALGWRWVRGWWFRLAHLAAIGCVVAQAWLGATCPLTTLESWLRMQGGAAGYTRSFVEHWLQWLIFYEGPAWSFTAAYTVFALAVAAAWWRFPPRRRRAGGPARP